MIEQAREGSSLYWGLAIPDRLRSGVGEQIGLPQTPYLAFDLGMWYYTGFGSGPYSNPTLFNIEGRYQETQVGSKLQEFGYEKLDHQNIFYYALHDDNEPALDYPLRTHTLNRISLLDDRFLAAAATDLLVSLIDVNQGKSDSLMDRKPYALLAGAAGEELLSGAFRSSSVIKDPGSPSNFVALSFHIYEKYMEGPDKWEALSPYDLALSGYRVRDGIEEIVIALYYLDAAAAPKDRDNLEHRWNTLRVDFPRIYEDLSVTEACAPFVTEVKEGQDYSMLVATCPLKRGHLDNRLFDNTFLWKAVPHWLLYPDLDELKGPQG